MSDSNGRKPVTAFAGIVAFLALLVTGSAAYNFNRVEKKVDEQGAAAASHKADYDVFKESTNLKLQAIRDQAAAAQKANEDQLAILRRIERRLGR